MSERRVGFPLCSCCPVAAAAAAAAADDDHRVFKNRITPRSRSSGLGLPLRYIQVAGAQRYPILISVHLVLAFLFCLTPYPFGIRALSLSPVCARVCPCPPPPKVHCSNFVSGLQGAQGIAKPDATTRESMYSFMTLLRAPFRVAPLSGQLSGVKCTWFVHVAVLHAGLVRPPCASVYDLVLKPVLCGSFLSPHLAALVTAQQHRLLAKNAGQLARCINQNLVLFPLRPCGPCAPLIIHVCRRSSLDNRRSRRAKGGTLPSVGTPTGSSTTFSTSSSSTACRRPRTRISLTETSLTGR